jgi:hypothetical protein
VELFQLIFLLFAGHALGDFALQNEFTATNKNRHAREKYTPAQQAKMEVIWPWLMGSHALHHGLIMYVITQNFTAALLETVAHAFIDFGKCERWYSFHADQTIHFCTKILWALLIHYKFI